MTEETKKIPHILQAVLDMTEALAKEGVAKQKATGGGGDSVNYAFRGIDAVRNAVAPLQATHKLIIYQSMTGREEKEHKTKSGGWAIRVFVKADMHFVSAVDGSNIVSQWENEAIDYSDKATNKALSQIYKNAVVNTFNIPIEGEKASDEEDHTDKIASNANQAFFDPNERSKYVATITQRMNAAKTLQDLVSITTLDGDTIAKMKTSDVPAERVAVDGFNVTYSANHQRIKKAMGAGKGQTVDALIAGKDEEDTDHTF